MKKVFLLLLLIPGLFISCSSDDDKDKISLNKNELTMNYEDKETLILSFSNDDLSKKDYKWSSSNENVATVNNRGYVEAVRVGEAILTVEYQDLKAQCKVTVEPTVNLYQEPYLEYGAGKSTIKSKEIRSFCWMRID